MRHAFDVSLDTAMQRPAGELMPGRAAEA